MPAACPSCGLDHWFYCRCVDHRRVVSLANYLERFEKGLLSSVTEEDKLWWDRLSEDERRVATRIARKYKRRFRQLAGDGRPYGYAL